MLLTDFIVDNLMRKMAGKREYRAFAIIVKAGNSTSTIVRWCIRTRICGSDRTKIEQSVYSFVSC